jgi:hypothetical protein
MQQNVDSMWSNQDALKKTRAVCVALCHIKVNKKQKTKASP